MVIFSRIAMVAALAAVALGGITLAQRDGDAEAAICNPQPDDDQKLEATLAEYLERVKPPPYRIEGDQLVRLDLERWSDLAELREAQPECCSIAYEDPETFKAPGIKQQMGEDFGGFAYISIAYLSDYNPARSGRAFQSYALSSCGEVLVTMSDD